MKSFLGFDEPADDEEPYQPNRAQRRAAQQQYRREAKAANKAWQRKQAERQRRRPMMQALQAEIDRGAVKIRQIDSTHYEVTEASE